MKFGKFSPLYHLKFGAAAEAEASNQNSWYQLGIRSQSGQPLGRRLTPTQLSLVDRGVNVQKSVVS